MYAVLFLFKFFFLIHKSQFRSKVNDTSVINKNDDAVINAAFNAIFYNNIIKHEQ